MRTRSLILLLLLVTLTGCVVTYGSFPGARVESLPKDHEPISFSYDLELKPGLTPYSDRDVLRQVGRYAIPNWYPLFLYVGEAEFLEVRHTLETSGMFSTLSEALGPSEQGSHCDITFILRGPSDAAFGMAVGQGMIPTPLMIFFIWDWIPYYSGEGELEADYRLFKDGVPQKTYQYTIKKKGAGGLLLLPFAWINFFTDDLKDALRATTLQFLIDAHRDGNL